MKSVGASESRAFGAAVGNTPIGLLLCFLVGLLGTVDAQARVPHPSSVADSDTVSFVVAVDDPASKTFHVRMRVHPTSCPVEVRMPSFTPGGFVQTHAKFVAHLRAEESGGAPASVVRTDKQTWQIQCTGNEALRLTYDVGVNQEDELRLVTNWLDDLGGFFFGTTLFLYAENERREPAVLELVLPPNWKVATPLAREDDRFVGQDYDELALAPVQFGELADRTLEAEGHEVRLVFDRPLPPHDRERLDTLIRNTFREQIRFFGSAPFEDYLILFHWRPDLEYGGGVARSNAMVMNIGSEWMEDLPANLEGTLVHELFHAWNGSAIRPRSLVRPDYSDEAYSDFFWFIEGVTDYYVYRTWQRQGRLSADRFLQLVASAMSALESSPGRGWLSLAEADRTYAAGGAEFVDARAGGVVAGFLFDLELRAASDNERSLDDFMRGLFANSLEASYAGHSRDEFVRQLSETAGREMSDAYRGVVEDVEPPDYAAWLDPLGIQVYVERSPEGSLAYRLERAGEPTPRASRLLDAFFQTEPANH